MEHGIRPLFVGVTPKEEEMFNFLNNYLNEGNEFKIGFIPDELGEKYADQIKAVLYRFMLILEHERMRGVN